MAIDERRQSTVMRQMRTLFSTGTATGLSDGELLGRFAARSGEASDLAFAALLERHGRMVWGTCRRVLSDPHDVEDAFQATFLILVRRARSIRNRDSLASWLHRVAYCVACSARSGGLRRRRHERLHAEQAQRLTPPPCDESLDLNPIVDGELLRLPERYRAVVVLCDMQGLSYQQAAHVLGWPMGTVKSRLTRGREKLRSRLIRRGIAPMAGLVGAEAPAELLRSTAQAASQFAVRPMLAGGASAQVISLTKGVIATMFLGNLKLSVAALAISGGLICMTGLLAGTGLGARVSVQESPTEPGEVTKTQEPAKVPSLPTTPPTEAAEVTSKILHIPAPWETVVGIRILSERSVAFGSGTIIQSTRAEALVMTCAHIFKLDELEQVAPVKFPRRIMVDLFDGKLRSEKPAHVTFDVTTGGEVVDYDFDHDVGLIRIRPGKQLPVSPIVPTRWEARPRMRMLTVGCSEGQDPTAWTTEVVGGTMRGLAGNPSYEAIECRIAPKQGRTGGGLFTTDGYLAGVCNFAAPQADQGLYATPMSIYRLLDRNGLSHLYASEPKAVDLGTWIRAETDQGEDAPPRPPGDDYKVRLEELKSQNARLQDELLQVRNELRSLRAGGQAGSGSSSSASSPSRPRDPNASPATQPRHAFASRPGPEAGAQGYFRSGGLIFAASPTGNRVIAYDPATRGTTALELNATKEHPLKVSFLADDTLDQGNVALKIVGSEIRRIAVFDLKSRTWYSHDLAEPVNGKASPYRIGIGDLSVAYDLGRHLYTFSGKSLAWDHLDVAAIPEVTGERVKGLEKPDAASRR